MTARSAISDFSRVVQSATVAAAATHTTDATKPLLVDLTVSGSTAAIAVPTGGSNRQTVEYAAYNSSGASSTVTFNASIKLSTGLSSRAFAIPAGQTLFASLKYSTLSGTGVWTLVAATVSA